MEYSHSSEVPMSPVRVASTPDAWVSPAFPHASADQVLLGIAGAGYAGTELGSWGFLPTDPPALKAALDARSLVLAGARISVPFSKAPLMDQGMRDAVTVARLVARVNPQAVLLLSDAPGLTPQRVRNAGRISPGQGLYPPEWRGFAAAVERTARTVAAETGLRTAFQPLCASWVETPIEIGILLERTDPELVGLCIDTGHILYGGGDPVELIGRWVDRVRYFRCVDLDPAVVTRARVEEADLPTALSQGLLGAFGSGATDFKALVRVIREMMFDGWVVAEPPPSALPFETARDARSLLRALGI